MGRQSVRNNMLEFRQYQDRKLEIARDIREKRCLLGLLQKDIYQPMGMAAGQYARIESGELNGDEVLKYINKIFGEWKKREIEKLKIKIKYLNSLC